MLLLNGELCVCDLMAILGEPQSKLSRHLAYLKNSGIVTSRRVGVWMHYALKSPLKDFYRDQLRLLEKKYSSSRPFSQDRKKMIVLKAEGECRSLTSARSAAAFKAQVLKKKFAKNNQGGKRR